VEENLYPEEIRKKSVALKSFEILLKKDIFELRVRGNPFVNEHVCSHMNKKF
jgi:hypothetical protein